MNTASVTVYGMVSGFEVVSVVVNGITGETLGGGGFSATVPLTEGANTLTAEVTGTNGETLSGVLHLTRKLTTGKLPDDMKAKGGCSAVYHSASEEDVVRVMQSPYTMIASDGDIPLFGQAAPHLFQEFHHVVGVEGRIKWHAALEAAAPEDFGEPRKRAVHAFVAGS